MKSLDAQNHYEVLEVQRGARPEEIERAYRMATATWAEGSLALYSLFEEKDACLVRDRIDDAYRVLCDEEARRAYDQRTFDGSPADDDTGASSGVAAEVFSEMGAALESTLEDGKEHYDEFDGETLRRARMRRGIEISDIAELTKVSNTHLRSLEEEAFDSLPAAVYVRGFVTAYARAIGLDAEKVVESYMSRLEVARGATTRGRLMGGG